MMWRNIVSNFLTLLIVLMVVLGGGGDLGEASV